MLCVKHSMLNKGITFDMHYIYEHLDTMEHCSCNYDWARCHDKFLGNGMQATRRVFASK